MWFFRKKSNAGRGEQAARSTTGRVTGAGVEPAAFEVTACVQTDVGCHREINEDHARYVRPYDAERLASKGTLLVVADGMGGHAGGACASHLAIDVLCRVYYDSQADVATALQEAFLAANRVIYEHARRDTRLQGMGTTCTALVLLGGEVRCAHVGDSRLYLVREGAIYQMSEDHSLVREMVRRGILSREEARTHEDRNVILRALGTKPRVEVVVWPRPFQARVDDQYLLCSDGLYDLVDDDEILRVVLEADLHDACAQLIALAKERGGHDNITVGLLRLSPSAAPVPTLRDTREVKAL